MSDVMRTIRDIVYICRSVSFLDKYSTPRNISWWLSDMLTLLPVFTQIFRLYFVSCFDFHKTDSIHSLLNMKFPVCQQLPQHNFKILEHTFHSYHPSLTRSYHLTQHELTNGIKHISAITQLTTVSTINQNFRLSKTQSVHNCSL